MYLVILETSGNQRYIFATNKLRENVGASHLTYLAGTKWVLDEVKKVTRRELWSCDPARLAANLQNVTLNPPIEKHEAPVEVIIATSGKALLLTQDEETARSLVATVTARALREAPGLDLCGVVEEVDWDKPLGPRVQAAHRRHQQVHATLPGPDMRFARLPFVAPCDVSGLPASLVKRHWRPDETPDEELLSTTSNLKRGQRDASIQRMQNALRVPGMEFDLPGTPLQDLQARRRDDPLDRFFTGLEWTAVVHADGNGLGGLFHRFWHYAGLGEVAADVSQANRTYVRKLRAFSLALEESARAACRSALSAVATVQAEDGHWYRPFVPLILGGDDLTVYCDGRSALEFTQAFLTTFEEKTTSHSIIREIAGRAFGGADHLAAAAGVAIIKPHFPFHTAYELADELCRSAKEVKDVVRKGATPWPCSALDFHILYDTMLVSLRDIRKGYRAEDDGSLYQARPYVVTCEDKLQGASGLVWAHAHHWNELVRRVGTLTAEDADTRQRLLPSSQMHVLREGLTRGEAAATARYDLVRARLGEAAEQLRRLEEPGGSLYRQEDGKRITALLDAMEVSEFLSMGGGDGR
jgi:hypothetical protein